MVRTGAGGSREPGTQPSSIPPGASWVHGIRPPTAGEFSQFAALVHRESGIHLSEAKQALLAGRLSRRVRELGMGTFGEYYALVVTDPQERVRMVDAICTNETHFFREPRQFEMLERQVLPAWRAAAAAGRRAPRARAWSAACSTGEEPYSLAMLLSDALPRTAGWTLDVLATDLSTRVLARAEAGVFPIARADEIPTAYLREYMLKGVGEQAGTMKAGPGLRSLLRFRRLNLMEDDYPVDGPFDLVFCRNVLIYFQPRDKMAVIGRLLRHLAPDGLLFLGHAESVTGLNHLLRPVGLNVYAHARCEAWGGRPPA